MRHLYRSETSGTGLLRTTLLVQPTPTLMSDQSMNRLRGILRQLRDTRQLVIEERFAEDTKLYALVRRS